MSAETNLSPTQAAAALWQKGILSWLLREHQKDLYSTFNNASSRIVVWSCSRQLGKSTTALIIALEFCYKKKNAIVKYVCSEQKMVRGILKQTFNEILQTCPLKLRPKFNLQQGIWTFPNGSEIQMAGADAGGADSIRGGRADLCIVDEAGFVDDLEYLVTSVLLPTTTTTKGKVLLASTPPVSPDHAFLDVYSKRAKAAGCFVQKTIDDNTSLTDEEKEELLRESGGRDSAVVKREYFCSVEVDQERAIIPEFNEAIQKVIIKPWPRPPFYDCYTSMDVGFRDLTFVLFAYYDFLNDKLIIEEEFTISGPKMTTEKLAEEIKAIEKTVWKNPLSTYSVSPHLRVSDNNLILINDLQKLHRLTFIPTDKDDLHSSINHLRSLIGSGRIIINPRCKNLISHLKGGIWNKTRNKFEYSTDEEGREHHYDGIAALAYLVRNISWYRNPYPANYDLPRGDRFVKEDYENGSLSELQQSIRNLFTVKPTIRRR